MGFFDFLKSSNDGSDRFQMAVPLDQRDSRRGFSPKQREEIWERDGGLCQIDGQPVAREDYRADHVTPWSHGGRTTLDNGQVTHRKCNDDKGDTCGPGCE